MQVLDSYHRDLGVVKLPEFKSRQLYMGRFEPQGEATMPGGFEDYNAVVSHLVRKGGVGAAEVFVTVDEKIVTPGMSQRRPGAHVDGCYLPEQVSWAHLPPGAWAHYCNNLPIERMAIITASSVPGCMVYPGLFKGDPQDDGNCEHLRNQFGEGRLLPAFEGFMFSPDCVHESMVFDQPTKRTFLRIAFAPEVISS